MRVIHEGISTPLGVTEATPTIGITDYSRRDTDQFGVTTIVERGFARRLSVRMALPTDEADALQRRLAALRASVATWVADEDIRWLSAEGYFKEFDIDVAIPPVSYCTLTVEGLAETEAAPDPGGDPAPDSAPSSLRLLDPVAITDAELISSSVPEGDAPEWAAGTTYALGAQVVRAHRVFESLIDGNTGNEPVGSTVWLDTGPTNRWAMFDEALGTVTSSAGSIVVTLASGTADAVALLDAAGASVRVQVGDYDETKPAGPGAVIFDGLPGGLLTLTIAGPDAAAGTLLLGRVRALGITEASPTAGITDFSRKEVDDFGEVTVVERAWVKRMSAKALIRTDAVDMVADRIAAVRARPSLWIGDKGLDCLAVYGFFKDFSIEVGPNVSKLSLTIEGLSEAVRPAPLVGAVDWPDVGDPDGTKPQDNADVTGENTAKNTEAVGGKPAEDVISELEQHELDIAAADAAIVAAEQQIADLFAIYGDTASASEAMLAAQAALTDAEQARDDAVARALEAKGYSEASFDHMEAAEGAVVAAEGHAQTASNERAAAVIARGQAVQAKEDAEIAEAGAATSAGLSATARGQAEGFADASFQHSQTAGAHAGAAGGSASVASEAALQAFYSARDTLPEGFTDAAYWSAVLQTPALDAIGWAFSDGVATATSYRRMLPKGARTLPATGSIRVTADARMPVGSPLGAERIYVAVAVYDQDGVYLGRSGAVHVAPVDSDWREYKTVASVETLRSNYPTAFYYRPQFEERDAGGGTSFTGEVQLRRLGATDVTSEIAAQSSAGVAEQHAADADGSRALAQSSSDLTATYAREALLSGNGNGRFEDGTTNGFAWSAASADLYLPHTQGTIQAEYQGRTNVLLTALAARQDLYGWKKYLVTPGAAWKLRAGFRINGNPTGAGVQIYMGIQCLDAAGDPVGTNSGLLYYVISGERFTTTGWRDREILLPVESILTGRPGTAQFRLIAWLNYDVATRPNTSVALDYYECIDATSEKAAQTHAGIAEDAKVVATTEAAAAQQSAVLSANIGMGSLNKNPMFADWTDPVASPASWARSAGTHARAQGRTSPWAADITSAAGQNSAVLAQTIGGPSEQTVKQGDWLVLEGDAILLSGTLAGAGVSFGVRRADGTVIVYLSAPFGTGGEVGKTYSVRKLVQVTSAEALYGTLWACAHLSAIGPISAANSVRFLRCSARFATEVEIRDQTVLAPLQATVTTQGQTLANLNSTYASLNTQVQAQDVIVTDHASAISTLDGIVAGQRTIGVDAQGRWVGLDIAGTPQAGGVKIHGDYFTVDKPGGGPGLSWIDGILWNRGDSVSVIQGQNFGTTNDLMFWIGPNPASAAAAAKSNAILWVDKLGNGYFGGSLSAGVIKNAAQATVTATNASIEVGPFGSNGNDRQVVVSINRLLALTWTGPIGDPPPTFTNAGSATIVLERWAGTAWTQIHSLVIPGQAFMGDPSPIPPSGAIVSGDVSIAGSFTVNDTTGGTEVRYRARIASFTAPAWNIGSWTQSNSTVTQSLGIVSTEE